MENVISVAIEAVRGRLVENRDALRFIQAAYPLLDLVDAIALVDVAVESLADAVREATGRVVAGAEPDG